MVKQSDRLAEVYAMLESRDEEFASIRDARYDADGTDLWDVGELERLLGYGPGESLTPALNRAKITLSKSGLSIGEHIIDGVRLGMSGRTFVTKVAAVLVVMNADAQKTEVAIAQTYFALVVEKRIRTRFEVNDENRRLQGAARASGVENFAAFNGAGVSALYGGLSVAVIQARKGLAKSQHYLDFAGSEELAANLFRITQTRAALERQGIRSEGAATETHRRIGLNIRRAIVDAGNTTPENLPPAAESINRVATRKLKQLGSE